MPTSYKLAKTASLSDLIELINSRYASIEALSVSEFKMDFKVWSEERGYLEDYRSATGYLVAQGSGSIYVNILNPLTRSTLVTMAANGSDFQIWIPRENKYLKGKAGASVRSSNPLYNVRPHHLLKGVFVERIPLKNSRYSFYKEEFQDRSFKYYVIVIIDVNRESGSVDLVRKIWIERSQLRLARQQFYNKGELVSNIIYGPAIELDRVLVSSEITIERKMENYAMHLQFVEEGVRVNRPIKKGTFQVPRPIGADVEIIERVEDENDN